MSPPTGSGKIKDSCINHKLYLTKSVFTKDNQCIIRG